MYSLRTGLTREQVSQFEASSIAEQYFNFDAEVKETKLLTSVGPRHEYRARDLLVRSVSFDSENQPVVYIGSITDQFEQVR